MQGIGTTVTHHMCLIPLPYFPTPSAYAALQPLRAQHTHVDLAVFFVCH